LTYPLNFEEKIGFDRIRDLIRSHCISDMGRFHVDEIRFSSDLNWIRKNLSETDEFKKICMFEAEYPVAGIADMRSSLENIQIPGTYLDLYETIQLRKSLEVIKSITQFFHLKTEEEYPYLKKLVSPMASFPGLIQKIDSIITKHGEIKDNASPGLLETRKSISTKNSALSKIIHKIMSIARSEGWVESDIEVSVRDGKMLIPVQATHKRKIKGSVYDESDTGKTVYIEPLESIEINNELRELEFAERREIIKILIHLADDIRPYIDDLLPSYQYFGILDFIRAKALLAIDLNAIFPTLIPECGFDLRKAVHPLLFLSHRKEKKTVVPLNVSLNPTNRMMIISGPNAGGKSVCLKTIGLLQYSVQCGLLVPVGGDSSFGIFERIFIDIGDNQSIDNDLSTYSSHLSNMKYFIENCSSTALALIDEFGSGTEPIAGGALAESILDVFYKNKTYCVITTHYTNLKVFASSHPGVLNSAMLFDSKNIKPLFVLETGKPGSSFAFEIAKNIGLPVSIIGEAKSKSGTQFIDFETQLQELDQKRRDINKLKNELLTQKLDLDKKIEKYNSEIEITLKQRKTILDQTNVQVKELLSRSNKIIENTIFEIKKVSAEKEKTKELRKNFEEEKEKITASLKSEEDKIHSRMEKIKTLKERKQKESENQEKNEKTSVQKSEKEKIDLHVIDPIIKVGDKVRLSGQSTLGEVIEIKDDIYVIMLGQMKTSIEKQKVEKISENEWKRYGRNNIQKTSLQSYSTRDIEFKTTIDLRGKRVEEAIDLLNKQIDDAIVVDFREFRILHGTGNGVLRRSLREYLKTLPLVKSIRDEILELGGYGITLVTLDF